MMPDYAYDFCVRLAKGIAQMFGRNCEVDLHDLTGDLDHSIVLIENASVTGRKVGDGISPALAAVLRNGTDKVDDRISYLTQTDDGRILKSTGIFLRDAGGVPVVALTINFDITLLQAIQSVLHDFTSTSPTTADDDHRGDLLSVQQLLCELIDRSVSIVGKPVALMNRQDKVRAIGFLNDCGAFLVTKSGQRVCEFFGISKYTLYSYIEESKHLDAASA